LLLICSQVDYTTGAFGPKGPIPWYNSKKFLTAVVTLLLFPLSLLRTPRSLGFVSLLSLFALFYTSILILASFLKDATDETWEYPDLSLARVDFSLISTFSTMVSESIATN
jgi:amino acid permease